MPLPGPGPAIRTHLRRAMLVVLALSLLVLDFAHPLPGHAKEADVIGTVDCGRPSGRRCELGETLVLRTDSFSGTDELVTIDIRWILRELPSLDQDDEIILGVELLPDGKVRALSVISAERRSGTENQGQSTGTRSVPESRSDRREQQEDDNQTNQSPVSGGVTVAVRSLLNGDPISGATVRLNGRTMIADATGQVTFASVEPGSYQVEASAPGFITRTESITVVDHQATSVVLTLATFFPDISATLTWAEEPLDLDLHLSGPATGGGRFHAFFLSPNPEPYAALTLVDDLSFGPEQVVIRRHPSTGEYVPGDYHIWAHNFSGSPSFAASQGRVVVTNGSQVVDIFEVGDASGDPNQLLWHVVNLQVSSQGALTVTPVQQLSGGGSVTILSPPYGPKRPRR